MDKTIQINWKHILTHLIDNINIIVQHIMYTHYFIHGHIKRKFHTILVTDTNYAIN